MKDLLLAVDLQNDFITGTLGTPEAQAILPAVLKRLETFPGEIIFTQDTHLPNYLDTQEGRNLPVIHCVKDTGGWMLHPRVETIRQKRECVCLLKDTFGSSTLPDYLKQQYPEGIASVTLIGLCTDICVISNAMVIKAFFPELPVLVDAACCAGVSPKSHNNALEAMKLCQIQILE